MLRLARWIAGPMTFAAACLMHASPANAEGLTGPTRAAFVDSTVRGCLNKALDNKSASASLVSQSCTCFAEGLANRTSNEEMLALAKLSPESQFSAMQPRLEALRKTCLDGIKKP